ncbi:MAG: hypothetical protein Q7T71_02440, partial [Herbiconiux sp.]|nr:hypothetical protein [Herbiconiux sp.]
AELVGDPEERLPAGVLSPESEKATLDPVLRWASPDVPEVAYDIYESGRNTADVAFIADRP